MQKIIDIKLLDFPWETQDPFLFCVHHRDEYPKGNGNMGVNPTELKGRNIGQDFRVKDGWRMYHGKNIPGFPYHPHRGFETITINKQGLVDHSDSLGAAGRFGAGDVQWMTAGKGIQHSEMFPLIHDDKENTLEIFQIWLNLPKKDKFVAPHFKMLWADMIPVIQDKDDNGKITQIDVIAGALNSTKAPNPTPNSWASKEEHGICVFTIKMEAGATWTLPAYQNNDVHRSLYFYRGDSIEIDGQNIPEYHQIKVIPTEDITIKNGNEDAYFLFLQGKPIGERVVQHGPFVMNSPAEIKQAFLDYQETQFGGWPWKETEVVHPKNKGRFALHADGKEEIKN